MGCDIHLYFERKEGARWRPIRSESPILYNHFSDIFEWDCGRNYTLFSLLAGVRNRDDIFPFKEPVGLPDDLSDEIDASSTEWSGDAHNHTWYYINELDCQDWPDSLMWFRIEFVEKWHLERNNVRIVMWFDN